jgi:hypothetical protein
MALIVQTARHANEGANHAHADRAGALIVQTARPANEGANHAHADRGVPR